MATTRDMAGWVFLILAVLIGALAFWLTSNYLDQRQEEIRAELEGSQQRMVDVVVAAAELVPGSVIGPETMAMGQLPSRHVSAKTVRPGEFNSLVGRVLSESMSSGEPLQTRFVSGFHIDRFSDLLAPGERAVTLEIDELGSNSQMLVPGDFIDVYVMLETSASDDGRSDEGRSLTPVIERVRVLAAGPEPLRAAEQPYLPLTEENFGYSEVTIGVPVGEAERVVLAKEFGNLYYLMRNSEDQARQAASLFDPDAIGIAGAPKFRYISSSVPEGRLQPIVGGRQQAAGLQANISVPILTYDQAAPDDNGSSLNLSPEDQ